MSSSPVGRALSTVDGGFDMERDLEGADGAEGESSLQAALAASRRAEAKSAQVLITVNNSTIDPAPKTCLSRRTAGIMWRNNPFAAAL